MRKIPWTILFGALLVGSLTGCDFVNSLFGGDESSPPPLRPKPIPHQGPQIAQGSSPNAVLENLGQHYRISPDRRFLNALPAIETIWDAAAEAPPPELAYTAKEKRWQVKMNDVSFSLAPLPSFEQLYGAVYQYGRKRFGDKLKSPPADLSPFKLAPPGLAALVQLNTSGGAWRKEKDVSALLEAATTAVTLLLGMNDRLGNTDEIASMAIALIVMTEVAVKEEMTELRSLLAIALGYPGYARANLAKIKGPALVHYLNEDREQLKKVVVRNPRQTIGLFLLCRLLIKEARWRELADVMNDLPGEIRHAIPLLSLALQNEMLREKYNASWTLLSGTVATAQQFASSPTEVSKKGESILKRLLAKIVSPEAIDAIAAETFQTGEIMRALERAYDQIDEPSFALFPSASFYKTWLRGHALLAIDTLASDLIDRLASVPAAETFHHRFGEMADPLHQQYFAFITDRIRASARNLSEAEALAHIRDTRVVGPRSLEKLYEVTGKQGPSRPNNLQAIKEMVRRCDSRHNHRWLLGGIFSNDLLDIAMGERLYRSIVDGDGEGNTDVAIWLARRDRDADRLASYVKDESLTPEMRGRALEGVRKVTDLPAEEFDTLYQKLIEADPASYSLMSRYAAFLEQSLRYDDAIAAMDRWLRTKSREAGNGLLDIAVKARQAEMHLKNRNPEAAWAIAEPLVDTMKQDALSVAVLIQSEMGNHDEAIDIAKKSLSRYEDPVATAMLARAHWHAGQNAEAAVTLRSSPQRLNLFDWRKVIGKAFLKTFELRAKQKAEEAFDAMLSAGIGHRELHELVETLAGKRHFKLAFTLNTKLKVPGNDMGGLTISSYGYKRAAESEGAALSWLKETVPIQIHGLMIQFGYQFGQYSVVWGLDAPKDVNDSYGAYSWVLRAASYTQTGKTNPEWQQLLEQYYSQPGNSFYFSIGKLLMGQVTPDQLWAQAQAADQRTEASYFIGIDALCKGEMETAINWLRVTLENGQMQEGETTWAYYRLHELAQSDLSLAELAKELKDDCSL